jgi:hypothetical protein
MRCGSAAYVSICTFVPVKPVKQANCAQALRYALRHAVRAHALAAACLHAAAAATTASSPALLPLLQLSC